MWFTKLDRSPCSLRLVSGRMAFQSPTITKAKSHFSEVAFARVLSHK